MTSFAKSLLSWYGRHRIAYPWRSTPDPYRIWVSEILLQQTRIQVALPFYERIVQRYPSFEALAEADPSEFLAMWSGIGYYRRAQHMLACAKRIVSEHEGRFPRELASLQKLPGVGPYTAGAIRNLCHGKLTVALDGNIRRVLARVCGCAEPMHTRGFEQKISESFLALGKGAPPGNYFQALMELGERVCLPVADCEACPVRSHCAAHRSASVNRIPVRARAKKSTVFHWYFLLMKRGNAYCFVQNPKRSFLKDAWLFPDLLSEHPLAAEELRTALEKNWRIRAAALVPLGSIRHAVTFRKITGHVYEARGFEVPEGEGLWLSAEDLALRHTSSVVRKVLDRVSAPAPAPG